MRLITCHLPEHYIDALNELVRLQRYPNRSEAIRCAIRDFIRTEVCSVIQSAQFEKVVQHPDSSDKESDILLSLAQFLEYKQS